MSKADRLDTLLRWLATLDRTAQNTLLFRLEGVVPPGLLVVTGLVNDPARHPLAVVLDPLVARLTLPTQREGLYVALAAWLDLVLVPGSRSVFGEHAEVPLLPASETPPEARTEEAMARVAAEVAMEAAVQDVAWTRTVRAWEAFRGRGVRREP